MCLVLPGFCYTKCTQWTKSHFKSLECCWVLFNNSPTASAQAPSFSAGTVLRIMQIGIGYVTVLCTTENVPWVYQTENVLCLPVCWKCSRECAPASCDPLQAHSMAGNINGRCYGEGDEILSWPKNAQTHSGNKLLSLNAWHGTLNFTCVDLTRSSL